MIDLTYMKRCSQRITITIPHNVYSQLMDLSDEQGRSTSNLCAYLLERSMGSPRSGD